MDSISGTLYVGVSNNVCKRSAQHKLGIGSVFTKKYGVNRLLYYQEYQYILNAIAREKQLKDWRREKKVALIETVNPTWRDLSKDFEKLVFLKTLDQNKKP